MKKIRPLRQGMNKELTAKRLVWELIQNAKDNVISNKNENKDVFINIELSDNKFIFTHNNGFFTNDNIRSLVRRTSSNDKNRSSSSTSLPNTTGRFGTGFMTTHLLSELVDIKGVFFNEEDNQYRPFSMSLDRRGQDREEIILGIEKAFSSANASYKNSSPLGCPVSDYKTQFTYYLEKEGVNLAQIAVEQLKYTAAYCLITQPTIKEIICTVKQNKYSFAVLKQAVLPIGSTKIDVYKVQSGLMGNIQYYASLQASQVKIIFPICFENGRYKILPIEPETPKLFLDFALVGTESFLLPFVLNSSLFEPTEPRDGINLSSSTDSDTLKNRAIFDEAIELFKIFVNTIENSDKWLDLFYLFNFKAPKDKQWIDSCWFKINYQTKIDNFLASKKLVQTQQGRLAILGNPRVYFPSSNSKSEREKLWELCNIEQQFILPLFDQVDSWHKIQSKYKNKLDTSYLIDFIEQKNNLYSLAKALDYSEIATIDWLNKVLELVVEDQTLEHKLLSSQLKILPNQQGKFKTLDKLSIDLGINESLKEVTHILGENWKKFLLHKKIKS